MLNKIKEWFLYYFWPTPEGDDFLTAASHRSFAAFCLLAGISGLAVSTLNLKYIEDYIIGTTIGYIGAIVCLMGPFLIRDTRNFKWAVSILAVFVYACLCYIALVGTTLISAANLFLIPMVMTTIFVLGVRAGIIGAFFTISVYIAVYIKNHPRPTTVEEGIVLIDWTSTLAVLCATIVFVVVGTSIFQSEMRRAAQNLRKAQLDAQASNKAKSEFLANMSHEIRTPMNGILGMAELLSQTELSNRQQLFATTIHRSGTALLDIINDILDFSKIEAGKLELEQTPFSFTETVEDVCFLMSPKAKQQGIEVVAYCDANIPLLVVGDVSRIRQILVNLVGNAVKFTEKGRVTVRLSSLMVGDEVMFQVDVEDTGVGIAPEKLEKIFEQFMQAENSTTRQFGGTGLGLAITKQLVEAMDGALEVTSKLGKGSCFTIRISLPLPAEDFNPADLPPSSKKEEKADQNAEPSKILKLLIAEDNMVNQMVIENLLGKDRYQMTFASNGVEVVEYYKTQDCDIVLMDISMPEMDGIEATYKIRQAEADENLTPVPIIALTAHALPGDRERFIAAGMDDYICKPIKKTDIENIVSKWGSAQTNISTDAVAAID